MRTLLLRITAVAAVVTLAGGFVPVQACDPDGHLDIGLEVRANRIETGIYDLNDPQSPVLLSPGVRVWGGRFQVNPLDLFFADDPGFGALSGSGLPAGSQIGFNVLDDLLYWDGTGPVQFGPVPDEEQLRIRFGFQNRYVGTSTGTQAGFNFESVGAGGTVHRHISFFLLGRDGNSTPASVDGVQATNGIYLLNMEITSTAPGLAPSEPIWIVFSNDADEAGQCLHCTALNHVGSHIAHDRPIADLDFDRDVDTDDLDRFLACVTGPGIPWTDPCCQNADLDGDRDVDQSDFGLLQRCFAGPGVIINPACAAAVP